MVTLNGCTTVNGGELVTMNELDPFNKRIRLQVEKVTHNPKYQIIAYYYLEKTDKGIVKNEVTIYRDRITGVEGSEVYRFKAKDSLQHYWSRNYNKFVRMPKKYFDVVKYIHKSFNEIYNS